MQTGAIWELDRKLQLLRCVMLARHVVRQYGHNIMVSPRGGLLMCEDANSTAINEYGPGERPMG
jgi:hypothetical protein